MMEMSPGEGQIETTLSAGAAPPTGEKCEALRSTSIVPLCSTAVASLSLATRQH